ncbi:MAG: hypothetical protein FWG07_07345 [Treponema sp.]|nr:hypothetical protein [Treponema sp.]
MINNFRLKSIFLNIFFGVCLSLCLLSCSMLGIPSGKNWSPDTGRFFDTLEIGTIQVDKNADWDSVESETKRLLPLLLAKAGYKQVSQGTALPEQLPAYKIDAVLIEREYMENWKTRRSLSAEILVWKNEIMENADDVTAGKPGKRTVLAAGKAILSGAKSFSSSKTLHDLLESALSNALRALPKK